MFLRKFRIGCLLVIVILIVAAFFFIGINVGSSGDLIDKYLMRRRQADSLPSSESIAHVCLSIDDETLIGAIAAINSMIQNTRHPVVFHLLVTQDAYANLRRWLYYSELKDINYEVKIFETEKVLEMIRVRLGPQELAKPMNYARFYYGEYFPDLHGNVVHIDNDCIVQGDVSELHKTSIAKSSIAAFSDDCSTSAKRFSFIDNSYQHYVNFESDHIKPLKMHRLTCSFNTGVYVFNIDKWRSENVTQDIEHWMILNTKENIYGNEKAGGGSQPPLMIVLYHRWDLLDPLWNVRHLGMTQSKKYFALMIDRAKILHWSGPHKPWSTAAAAPFADKWRKYYVADPSADH